ncbi:universal stress protein [Glaciihabitans sp. UYNi722]|uniref:universal stress protein n=1 Tax=Glaciihabitans sp. UYNi722 TaxID=3156344 RepID=UPI0033986B55
MSIDSPTRSVVVGVTPTQPESVVLQATSFAAHFDAQLVCAWVDGGRYPVEEFPDGTVRALPFDPDLAYPVDEQFPDELAVRLKRLLGAQGAKWSTRALAGDPAQALGHLADLLDATMIVVGTRRATVRGTMQEFFNGSVAVHLAHRQRRPVVVIPLAPVGSDDSLPWEPAS